MANPYLCSIAERLPNGLAREKLADEIGAVGLSVPLLWIDTDGDELRLKFYSVITADDEALLDGVLAAHEVESLAELKARRFVEVDVRTVALIDQGFAFAGKVFSLSVNAQSYWTNAYQARSIFTVLGAYPLTVNTLDDLDSHTLADEAAVEAAYVAAVGTVKAHLGSGTDLKSQIRAAATKAEVNAVVDAR